MTMSRQRGVVAVTVLGVLAVVGAVMGALLPPPEVHAPLHAPIPVEWLARAMLVLALMWVAIGAVAARTRLVGKPGAAAARATWLSATRPWRARESTLGLLPLDRWLIFFIPLALLLGTRVLQTAAVSIVHLGVLLGAWLVFAIVLRTAVGTRSPWPVIAAVAGVVVLRCILTLVLLSIYGAGGVPDDALSSVAVRALLSAFTVALFWWMFVAGAWALKVQGGGVYAVGAMFAAIGAAILVPAVTVAIAGVDGVIAQWEDGLGFFVSALTVLIPADAQARGLVTVIAAGIGLALTVVGVALVVRHRRAAP